MSITRYFPNGTNGDGGTAANTGGQAFVVSGGTIVITNTAPLINAHLGARFTASSTSGGNYTQRSDIGGATAVGFDDYFTYETACAGAEVALFWIGSGSTRDFLVSIGTNGKLVLRDSANTVKWTAAAALTASSTTIVRIAGYVTQSATTGTITLIYQTGTTMGGLSTVETLSTLTGQNTGASGYTDVRAGAKCVTSTGTAVVKLMGFGIDPAASGIPAVWTLASENVPPVVSLTADKPTIYPGDVCTLTATATDSDGTVASTSWSTTGGTLAGTGLTRTITAPPALTDTTVTVTFTATDDLGATSTTTATITLKASAWRLCGTPGTPLAERLVT